MISDRLKLDFDDNSTKATNLSKVASAWEYKVVAFFHPKLEDALEYSSFVPEKYSYYISNI